MSTFLFTTDNPGKHVYLNNNFFNLSTEEYKSDQSLLSS